MAADLVRQMLHTGKVGEDGVIPVFADRLYADLCAIQQRYPDWGVATVIWGMLRLATAEGQSVARYIRAVRGRVLVAAKVDVLRDPVVTAFLSRLGELRGTHTMGVPAVILIHEYRLLMEKVINPAVRAVVALGWRRIARVADVLEVRVGGLWPGPRGFEVWVEAPFTKTGGSGVWDRYLVVFEPFDYLAVLPFLAAGPPASSPVFRPLLFPQVTTALVAERVSDALGRRVGGHSLRRSALLAAVAAGVPIPAAILLSGHASPEGAAPYLLTPDQVTAASMRAASAATTSAPVWHPAASQEDRAGFSRTWKDFVVRKTG